MTNMVFFIPIEDLDLFIEKSDEMGIQILSTKKFPQQTLAQVDIITEDLTGVFCLGTMTGYRKAYLECTKTMDNAMASVSRLKEKFEKLQILNNELKQTK